MSPTPHLAAADGARQEEFAQRMRGGSLAALELLNVELGGRLGLYERLAEHGSATPGELAERAGIAERYAREWLEQQAAAGVVSVQRSDGDGVDLRFVLPADHVAALLDPDSEVYVAPLVAFVAVAARMLEFVAEAFRTGHAVPYADYGVHDIQASYTRPIFVNHLTAAWLPAIPETYAALRAGTARVAEIGSGGGFAAVQIARDFPGVTVDGFDTDDASVAAARKLAADAGMANRVRFEVRDASRTELAGAYDLVVCIDTLHDVAHPIAVLQTMRRLRGPGGTVLVVDGRTAEAFTPDAGEIERLLYARSTLHCLPVGMVEDRSAGTGAVLRPRALRPYAAEAGFARVDELAVHHPQFRLYRLEG